LPLGVDIGTSRARIALAERSEADFRLRAVASRDIVSDIREEPALVAALLEEMIGELGVRDRRCVAALPAGAASLRIIRFPKMSWQERLRAALFESQRFTPQSDERPSVVRVHRAQKGENTFAVGAASKEELLNCVSVLKLARLRVAAVDHDALALRRAIGFADAIIDIGEERSTLHLYAPNSPFSHHVAMGGAEVTRGIARELSVDVGTAERRKRILGSAGAGISMRDLLVSELASVVKRARSRSPIGRIALVGNGARLPNLVAELEAATQAIVELPVAPILETDVYPEDVIRAAAPDWTLAAALTTWGHA
jgi:Tfp pilus assembly PilM family ATPase